MDAAAYKVLIADDEYWTREKIRNMICWEKYSLEFMEPAVDGEDVLNKIQLEEPDILITDINMPFINGVELLSIIKDKYPDIITFVISGYDDFQYVKDTFMSGAINYLVKPVTKIDLVNALSKALEIISTRRCAKQEEEERQMKLLKAASLIQDREFSLLVEREDTPFTPTITMNSEINFAGASLMLIKIHNLNELMKKYQYDMNKISYHVKKEIKNIVSKESSMVFNHIFRSNEFIVVSEIENEELKKAAEKLIIYLAPAANSPVTACISEHSYTMDSIHMAYIQTVALFMTRIYENRNEILIAGRGTENQKKVHNQLSSEYEKQIKSLLQRGNKSALKQLIFDTIGLRRCQEEKWEYLEVKQTVKKILNIFTDYTAEQGNPKKLMDMENMADVADKIIELLDADVLCEVLCDIIEFAVTNQGEAATDSIRSVVKQAVQFIDSNYFEELSLSSLAQQFNVESSYFSKMFRQETGENLMVYITRLRVEKAKEFMANKEVSLTEIAFMVGYDDYTYFSRVFRKVEGKSPRDYRTGITGQREV